MDILQLLEKSTPYLTWFNTAIAVPLALERVYAIWRDRFRVDVEGAFSSSEYVGNEITIYNLGSRPLTLTYWELFFKEPKGGNAHQPFESPEPFDGPIRIDAHGHLNLTFCGEHYFSTSPNRLKGRTLFIELHFAGRRRPVLKQVYPHKEER